MADCVLHEHVFRGDLQAVQKLLEKEDPSEKDAHGNLNVLICQHLQLCCCCYCKSLPACSARWVMLKDPNNAYIVNN